MTPKKCYIHRLTPFRTALQFPYAAGCGGSDQMPCLRHVDFQSFRQFTHFHARNAVSLVKVIFDNDTGVLSMLSGEISLSYRLG